MSLFDIFYFSVTPLYIYNIWSYFQLRFGQNNETVLKNVFFCAVSYILISLAYIIFNIPVLTVLINIFCFIMISSLFTNRLFRQITESLILLAIFISFEFLIATLLNFYTIDYQDASSYQTITAVAIVYLIEFVFIKYLSRRNYQSLHYHRHPFLSAVQLIVPFITTLLFLLLINNPTLTEIQFISLSLFLLLINIVLFELYDALARNFALMTEQQNFKQEHIEYANQLKLLESHNEEWQQFRHDLNNRLTPLYGFVNQYPNTELKDIIVNIIPDQLEDPLVSSGHPVIDAINNAKLQAISDADIEINCDILVPKTLNIQNIDLAVIIGNLLDNAIEGCLTIPSHRFINLKMRFENNQLKLNISNSFDGILRKQGSRILSRKEDTAIHGFGLTSILRLVRKYKGFHSIENENGVFTLRMILNDDNS